MSTEAAHAPKRTLFQRMQHSLFIAAYLWLLLSVFTLHNAVASSQWNVFAHLGEVTVKALLFGKFVLIAEHLHLGHRAERYALIFPVTIKAALFAITIIAFDVAEELLVHALRAPAPEASPGMMELTSLPQVLAITFMAFIALLPFFAINELGRVIGQDRLRDLFFKPQA